MECSKTVVVRRNLLKDKLSREQADVYDIDGCKWQQHARCPDARDASSPAPSPLLAAAAVAEVRSEDKPSSVSQTWEGLPKRAVAVVTCDLWL
jgi:hypothetical protein